VPLSYSTARSIREYSKWICIAGVDGAYSVIRWKDRARHCYEEIEEEDGRAGGGARLLYFRISAQRSDVGSIYESTPNIVRNITTQRSYSIR